MYSYFAAFGLYLCIIEGVASRYGVFFFCALICFILAAILILKNTLWLPAPILKINNETIASHSPQRKSMSIEWVNVSSVNVGPGYIVFLIDGGQKQRKLELSELKYEDVIKVKGMIIELCGHKNIPYKND